MELYIYAALGVLVVVLISLEVLNRGTPKGMPRWLVYGEWFILNWLYLLIGVILLGVTMTIDIFGFAPPTTNAEAFVRGIALMGIVEQARKLINPIPIETTTDNKIETK